MDLEYLHRRKRHEANIATYKQKQKKNSNFFSLIYNIVMLCWFYMLAIFLRVIRGLLLGTLSMFFFGFCLFGFVLFYTIPYDAHVNYEYSYWELGQWNYPFNAFSNQPYLFGLDDTLCNESEIISTKLVRLTQKDLIYNNKWDYAFRALVSDRVPGAEDQRILMNGFFVDLFFKDPYVAHPYFFPFYMGNLETPGPYRNRFFDIFYIMPFSGDSPFVAEFLEEEDDSGSMHPIDFYIGMLLFYCFIATSEIETEAKGQLLVLSYNNNREVMGDDVYKHAAYLHLRKEAIFYNLANSKGFIGEMFFFFAYNLEILAHDESLLFNLEEEGEFFYIYDVEDEEFLDNESIVHEAILGHAYEEDGDIDGEANDHQDWEHFDELMEFTGLYEEGEYFLMDQYEYHPMNIIYHYMLILIFLMLSRYE